jgi:hypothetical protein
MSKTRQPDPPMPPKTMKALAMDDVDPDDGIYETMNHEALIDLLYDRDEELEEAQGALEHLLESQKDGGKSITAEMATEIAQLQAQLDAPPDVIVDDLMKELEQVRGKALKYKKVIVTQNNAK